MRRWIRKTSGGNSRTGFTIIELLVVIAIIGVLAAITLASLNTARRKARDGQRIGHIRQLQLAIELYFDSNSGAYPAALSDLLTGCSNGSACIPAIPVDPINQTPYLYVGCGTGYHLATALEADANENRALGADLDGNANVCPGDTIDGTAETALNQSNASCVATAGGGRYCYDVGARP
ncbi:MAG: type II secretion system protein [Candidatus Sungbacteria bacterium]|uniref:Type II secretion system protein n=1 Tax=Candidatus Sungiibacteriota bacterium TaxID=2750080 RepID=A0A932YWR6_9BACT|nr:type II secretion system protein [Candidatus Sungbacteria bacterium]